MGFQFGVPVADDQRYEEALRRREEIQVELQRLQRELVDIDEFVSLYQRLFKEVRSDVSVSDTLTGDVRRIRQRNILPPARLAEMCRDIIRTHGSPMTRTKLLEAVQARGISLAGSDPSKNLGTIMWRRQDLFINIPGRGYWLRDVPVPE